MNTNFSAHQKEYSTFIKILSQYLQRQTIKDKILWKKLNHYLNQLYSIRCDPNIELFCSFNIEYKKYNNSYSDEIKDDNLSCYILLLNNNEPFKEKFHIKSIYINNDSFDITICFEVNKKECEEIIKNMNETPNLL